MIQLLLKVVDSLPTKAFGLCDALVDIYMLPRFSPPIFEPVSSRFWCSFFFPVAVCIFFSFQISVLETSFGFSNRSLPPSAIRTIKVLCPRDKVCLNYKIVEKC